MDEDDDGGAREQLPGLNASPDDEDNRHSGRFFFGAASAFQTLGMDTVMRSLIMLQVHTFHQVNSYKLERLTTALTSYCDGRCNEYVGSKV